MKRITFRELLNLIHDEKVPNRIIYEYNGDENNDREYQCTRVDYTDCEGEFLSNVIGGDLSVIEMTWLKCIIIYDEILTDIEKEYLSNIIKPFKKYVTHIRKEYSDGQEQIVIVYKDYLDRKKDSEYVKHHTRISLPSFKEGTMYKDMALNR